MKIPAIEVTGETNLDEVRKSLGAARDESLRQLKEEASEARRRYEKQKKGWDEKVEREYARVRGEVVKLRAGLVERARSELKQCATRMREISEQWHEVDTPMCSVCAKTFPGLVAVEDEDIFMSLPCGNSESPHKMCLRCFLRMLAVKKEQPPQTLTVKCHLCRAVIEYDVRTINVRQGGRRGRRGNSNTTFLTATVGSPFTPNEPRG